MASNRIEHVLADIGAMHAGATPMSIYNTLSPSQVAYVAGHSDAGGGRARDRRPRRPLVRGAGLRRGDAGRGDRRRTPPRRRAPSPGTELLERGRSMREQHQDEVDQRWQAHRPRAAGHDPLHLRHHRQPQGRGDHPPQRALRGREQHPHRRARRPRARTSASPTCPTPTSPSACSASTSRWSSGAHLHLVGDPAQLVAALGEVRPTRFFGVPRVWEKIQTGIGGLLAMETDEAKKQAVADAMAVGLEYVESLQFGHETSPELQARYDAVDAAVLTPMKSMLGLDRVTWAGSASAPMPLETARFFAGLGLRDLRHLRDDRDHRLGHRLRSRPLPARHRRPRPARHRDRDRRGRRDPHPWAGDHQRLPPEPRGHRRADRRRRLGAHRRHRRDRRATASSRWSTARRR